jgi:hypothetical protein
MNAEEDKALRVKKEIMYLFTSEELELYKITSKQEE